MSELKRFDGTITKLCDVRVASYAAWLKKIPAAEWPKLSDPSRWCLQFQPLSDLLMAKYPGAVSLGTGLLTMEPGQVHPAHRDEMRDDWLVRLHVPIVTNPGVVFTMDDGEHRMKVGAAYEFNTLAAHAVVNGGKTPRVHFVLDVGRP